MSGHSGRSYGESRPVKFFSWWTYLQKYQKADRVDPDLSRLGDPPQGSPAEAEEWVQRIRCDAIVLLEFDPNSCHAPEPPEAHHDDIRRCLRHQSVFLPVKQLRVPEYDCEIILLRRDPGQKATSQTACRKRHR